MWLRQSAVWSIQLRGLGRKLDSQDSTRLNADYLHGEVRIRAPEGGRSGSVASRRTKYEGLSHHRTVGTFSLSNQSICL